MTRLTPHFTLEEFTFSQTAARKGIDNTPHEGILDNLCILANGMENVRSLLNAPIYVSSGYRCPDLMIYSAANEPLSTLKVWLATLHLTLMAVLKLFLLILLLPTFLSTSLFLSLIGGFISLSLKMAELLENRR